MAEQSNGGQAGKQGEGSSSNGPVNDPRLSVEPRKIKESTEVDVRKDVSPRILKYGEDEQPTRYDK